MQIKKKYNFSIAKAVLFTLLLTLSVIFITQADESSTQPLEISKEQILQEQKEILHRRLHEVTLINLFEQEGISSHYGKKFHRRKTSSGELFLLDKYTAAHRKLPFGTIVRVINQSNQKTSLAIINDRGPFVRKRIIDVSGIVAEKIGSSGIPPIKIQTILDSNDSLKMDDELFITFSLINPPQITLYEHINVLTQSTDFTYMMDMMHILQEKHPYINYTISVASSQYFEGYRKERLYYLGIVSPDIYLSRDI